MDTAPSSQRRGLPFEASSSLGKIFTCSYILTTPVSQGLGVWRGMQAYLIGSHCLASLGLAWAGRGMCP